MTGGACNLYDSSCSIPNPNSEEFCLVEGLFPAFLVYLFVSSEVVMRNSGPLKVLPTTRIRW